MSNNEGAVRPYSEAAFNRGVVVGGTETVHAPNHVERSGAVWIGGTEPTPMRPQTGPSAVSVDPVGNTRVEGEALDTWRPGLLASVLDATGEVLNGRAIQKTDSVEVPFPSGRPVRMPVRMAIQSGYLAEDAH